MEIDSTIASDDVFGRPGILIKSFCRSKCSILPFNSRLPGI